MSMLFGKNVNGISKTVDEIFHENMSLHDIVIEGEVFQLEVRGPFGKNQSYLHKGFLYDGTNSISFQFFAESNNVGLEEGKAFKIKGDTEITKYSNGEYVVSVGGIAKGEMKTKEAPKDEAENKRVELQTYSFMSWLSGASPVENYVKRAKEWGHSKIAITDRMSTQAYPSAISAAKKHEMELIYGMTGLVVDRFVPIIHNPVTKERFKDATYTIVDVETTGFSVMDDHLIEIGAAKFRNGELIDTLNFLIKTPKPIPAHITNLTQITNEMVETEGVALKEAIDAFEEFRKDSILVAHNAQFDRDHIKMAYKRSGYDMPTFELLDTLQLSRAIRKKAKKHGLGQLTKTFKVKLDNHHRASDDAVATGHVLYALFEMLENTKALYESKEIPHLIERLTEAEVTEEKCKKEIEKAFKEAEVDMEFYDYYEANKDKIEHVQLVSELNNLLDLDVNHKNDRPTEITIWVQNKKGLKNLYKILSLANVKYQSSGYGSAQSTYPVIPWDELEKCREGLIIGSGSHLGTLFNYALDKMPIMVAEEMRKYDVIEIQPHDVAKHLWNSDNPSAEGENSIIRSWKTIYEIARKMKKTIVASGHVNCMDQEDMILHNMIMYSQYPPTRSHDIRKGKRDYPQGNCHFRTTNDMMDSFPWLPKEETEEIVVTNTNTLADSIEHIDPIPKDLFTPKIEGINEEFYEMAMETAGNMYGTPIPAIVEDRLKVELDSIIGNGFAVIYMISQKLVKKSNDDGYLVGSRGSIGSSFAATMTGITEVNPLKPHYLCKNKECKWHLFFDHEELGSGYDLPFSFKGLLAEPFTKKAQEYFLSTFADAFGITKEKMESAMMGHEPSTCPKCKEKTLIGEGQDIPFETFLGFKGDKVPDIDLNFSGVYQPTAHAYVAELFGEEYVFRAGTILTVADKTAFAFAKNYAKNNGLKWSSAEIGRMANLITGAKRGTGQHPGGMLVVPDYMEMIDLSPYQYPSDKLDARFQTSHFDFHAIHDNILKLDILGHEAPTMLRLLQDETNIDPKSVPPADPKVLELFHNPEKALGVKLENIGAKTGTLGIPEMGTKFVQDMLLETRPNSFAELVKISGLSHGTDVWIGNAQELVNNQVCEFKEVIGCRDDIMVYLIQKGLQPSNAFTIMESVRKGKGLQGEWEEDMRANDVPEWYIKSCKKIKYMFPKAHASAYVLDAMRIGWYKVYKPLEYYVSIFSSRFYEENVLEILSSSQEIRVRMEKLREEVGALKGKGEANKALKVDKLVKALNMALEAKERGIEFSKIRLYQSHATKYLIDFETNELIPPFSSIDGIGETAAVKLYEEAQKGIFRGVDDLMNRTKINKTNLEALRQMGCLGVLEEVKGKFF